MHGVSLLISITLLVSGSLAAVCPRFASVTNLNLQQFVGNWGIHGLIVSQGADPRLQCLHMELSGSQFTKEPVNIDASLHGVYRDTGAMLMEDYAATIPTLARPGRWQVNVNGTVYDFSILQTDYVEYSLMAMCSVVNDVEQTKVLLASRSHTQMPENIVNNYKSVLESQFNIDTSLYFQIIHDHDICH